MIFKNLGGFKVKKYSLLIVLFLITSFSFAITLLKDITYNTDISYAATDVERALTNFGIEEGYYVGDIDIRLALQDILKTGYFTSVSYNLDEEAGSLELIFTPNPIVSKYEVVILGDGLIDKKNIKSVISLESNIPVNLNKMQSSMKNIQDLYMKNGYQFVDVYTNLQITGEGISIEATEINDKTYDSDTLLFIVKEYTLWDLELRGELAQLNVDEIKERLSFDFRKDWNSKFFLFRPNAKETYPSFQKIQNILNSLNQIPFFSADTNVRFEIIDIPENKGGELILVLEGSLRKIVEDEPVTVSKINFVGNESIEDFRLNDAVQTYIVPSEQAYNLDLLYAYDSVLQTYFKEGYIYTNIIPKYENEELIFEIRESKVGSVEITQEATAKTQKYILDSLVKINSGEPVNQKKLQDTYVSFVGTGFFKDVWIQPFPEEEDVIGFRITPIESDKIGKLIGGVTWTMPDEEEWYKGFSGELEVQWLNPFGYGQTFSVNTSLNPLRNRYVIGFDYNVIKLGGSNLDLGANISYVINPDGQYFSNIDNTAKNYLSLGISPRYELFDFSYLTGSISYNNYSLVNEDKLNVLSGSVGYLYNNLDSPYRPYNGQYFQIKGLGGIETTNTENYYIGFDTQGKLFRTYYKFTPAVKLRFGSVYNSNEDSNLNYKFGVGGMYTVRTYDFNQQIGNFVLQFNTELSYELVRGDIPLDVLAFLDYGSAQDSFSDLTLDNSLLSFGGGLRTTIPLFGQISFGYGWDKDLDGHFWFGFGQTF